jgi:hypothetical protein
MSRSIVIGRAEGAAGSLHLPIDVVTQTLAAIGRKGAGKTYLATMLAEEMLDANAQVVVLDPVGNWWGLRVGADGRSKGKQIFVIGGDHGDVPLVPEAGAKIAKLIVERRVSAVLDVSSFRIGERKRFAADFAEEFFHMKKSQRSPVHLFVEEAQLFAPQRPQPDENRMLGAYEAIIRLGRNYGVGCTMITQRPQSVNKEVLSQVECLCVLQVNGVHERKALEEWVQEQGADRKLVGLLPSLQRGEGYLWSPSWLRRFDKVHFKKKETFDASATPEVGKATKAASLSAVDVAALREDMAEVVAAAEKDDPKALRNRIATLERDLRTQGGRGKETVREVPVMAVKETQAVVAAIDKLIAVEKTMVDRLAQAQQTVTTEVGNLRKHIEGALRITLGGMRDSTRAMSPVNARVHHSQPSIERTIATAVRAVRETEAESLGHGVRKMLHVVASRHPEGVTVAQLGILAGYAPGGGTFRTYLPVLVRHGLIEKDHHGVIRLTEHGIANVPANRIGTTIDPEVVRREWSNTLKGGVLAMFQVLLTHYPNAITKDQLAAETGFAAGGGTFRTYLPKLKRLGLVEEKGGLLTASSDLF